ncbi:MAG: hypothetical protein ACOCW2_02665 [Chitinivibrionales bacterium]
MALFLCRSLLFAGAGLEASAEYRTDNDFLLSGSALFSRSYRYGEASAFFTFGGRTYGRKEFVLNENREYDQLKEHRLFGILGFDATLMPTSRAGLYGKAGFGYSGGFYRGTSRTPPERVTPVVGAGVQVSSPKEDNMTFSARLGYVYKDMCTDSPHGITLSFRIQAF